MGFFSSVGNINKINTLLKRVECKINVIQAELGSGCPDRYKVKNEAGTISVLMSEIFEIADSSANSVKLAPYYLFGRKLDLFQISALVAGLVEGAERL